MRQEFNLEDIATVLRSYADASGLRSIDTGDGVIVDTEEALEPNQLLPVFLLHAKQCMYEGGAIPDSTNGHPTFPFTFEQDPESVSNIRALPVSPGTENYSHTAGDQALMMCFLGASLSTLVLLPGPDHKVNSAGCIEGASISQILKELEHSNIHPSIRNSTSNPTSRRRAPLMFKDDL